MNCPSCGTSITRFVRAEVKRAKSVSAAKAGAAGIGESKRRDVDYAALAAKRWAKVRA